LEPSRGEILGGDARQPSTALVPRLHAISVRKLPFFHPLVPFSPDWLTEARLAAAYQAARWRHAGCGVHFDVAGVEVVREDR